MVIISLGERQSLRPLIVGVIINGPQIVKELENSINEVPKKYNDEDGKTILDSEDDVATVKWGKKCRIPSQQDFKDLDAQCTWVWKKKYNGTCGYLVTGPNGSTLFFPASGYKIEDKLDGQEHGHYWSSNRKKKNIQDAYRLYFYIGDVHEATGTKNRYWGMPIRPVAENK